MLSSHRFRHRWLGLLPLLAGLLALPLAAQQVWKDDAKGLMVVSTPGVAARSADEARNQMSAFFEGLVHAGQVVPRSVRASSVAQLPALEIRGDVLEGPPGYKFVSVIAFAEGGSFVVHGFGREAPPLAVLEAHGNLSGKPLAAARPAVDDVAGKMAREIVMLGKLAQKIHDDQKAARH